MTAVSLPGHQKGFTSKKMGSHRALLRKEVI